MKMPAIEGRPTHCALPASDQLTVVLNGATLSVYDSRTETARVLRGSAWQRLSISPLCDRPVRSRARAKAGTRTAYKTGAPSTAGRCWIWTGRYVDRQRWLSFQRGKISVVISTNSLSTRDLVRYASDLVCT
jgi:hypothetical protein